MTENVVDVLIIGGGINGSGIARDAAGRGLKVLLCEKDDLAAHTSSASTKLIHGGLRYLEFYEFGLVRKALIEREVLLRTAPHIIHPLRFVMPYTRGQRSAWMIRAGLFLYDHLARRELLPGSASIKLRQHVSGQGLKSQFQRAFMYSDGWVNDARLVVLNAMDAAEKGATVLTRTRCVAVHREADSWHAELRKNDGTVIQVQARSLVNAAGPWVMDVVHQLLQQPSRKTLRLIKGSHIVVRRLFEHPFAYIFQHVDGRIVFAIPFEHDFTLIGTTDLDYDGNLDSVNITPDETNYLCTLVSVYFEKSVHPDDVVWSYSGVRPLIEDQHPGAREKATALTRDYQLDLNVDGPPLLNVFGGKITTHRKLSEEAMTILAPLLGNTHAAWTSDACLPGGDICGKQASNRAVTALPEFVRQCQQQYAWLPPELVQRYVYAYGTRIHRLLANCQSLSDMGPMLMPGLYATEITYLVREEWALSAEDILWRRTRLGLHLQGQSTLALDAWLAGVH